MELRRGTILRLREREREEGVNERRHLPPPPLMMGELKQRPCRVSSPSSRSQ